MCYDIIFKSLFIGQENILGKMISDITGIDYKLLKDNIVLETNELPINKRNEKAKRCDFVLTIGNGNIINLELNNYKYAGVKVKNLSYLFQLFSTVFKKGESYNENLLVMQINLNCYRDEYDIFKKALSKYYLIEDASHRLYVKNIEIYELNVVKCYELYYNGSNREEIPNYVRWGALINCNNIDDISDILKGFVTSKERDIIMDKLNSLTRDDLFMSEEDALKWDEWERNSIRNEWRSEALREGRKEGSEETLIKTIKEMLKKDISLEDISDITGKSIEEIKELADKE